MATTATVPASAPPQPPRQRNRTRPAASAGRPSWSRRAVFIGAGLVAAWALPVAAHLAHADVVILAVVLLGTAALLRVGSALLDRLVFAACLDAGLLMVFGLAYSWWPWGIQPVAVGGAALTLLVIVGVGTGRRPHIPIQVRVSDLAIVGPAIAAFLVQAAPTMAADRVQELAYSAINGDRLRQFALFDAVRGLGGYPFLNYEPVKNALEAGMGTGYPSGMHLVYAVIDVFLTGIHRGDPVGLLSRYYWYVIASYAAFVLVVAWAARWIAGATLTGWRATFACTAVGAFLATGILTTQVWSGFDAETFGLLFLAVTIAVVVRPPRSTGEQLLLTCVFGIATVYSYWLFGLFVIAALPVAFAVYRRRLRRAWRTTTVAVLVGLPIVVAPVIVPHLKYKALPALDQGNPLLLGGFIVHVPKGLLLALAVLAALALMTPTLKRSSRLIVLAGALVFGAIPIVAVRQYQIAETGSTLYYFHKLSHGVIVLCLLAGGAAVSRLPRMRPERRPLWPATKHWFGRATACAAAAVAAVVLTGSLSWGAPVFRNADMQPGPDTTWGEVWASGKFIYARYSDTMGVLTQAGLLDGVPTLVVFDAVGGPNMQVSLFVNALNRTEGITGASVLDLQDVNGLVNLKAEPDGRLSQAHEQNLTRLQAAIAKTPGPLRVIVTDRIVAKRLRNYGKTLHGTQLTVRLEPHLPRQHEIAKDRLNHSWNPFGKAGD